MHEASIAQGIIDIAQEHLRRWGLREVKSISVRVGAATGGVVEALRFAFDAMKLDTPLEGAELVVERVPLQGQCLECGRPFECWEQFVLACPHCRSPRFRLRGGRELDVLQMEAE